MPRLAQLKQEEDRFWAMIQGNPAAGAKYEARAAEIRASEEEMLSLIRRRVAGEPLTSEELARLTDLVNQFGSPAHVRELRKIRALVKGETVDQAALDEASDALRAIEQRMTTEARSQAALPDYHALVDELEPNAKDDLFHLMGVDALELAEDTARAARKVPATKFANLTPDQQAQLADYIEHAKAGLSQAKFAGVRFGEAMRDYALLNYNRRTKFDSMMSLVSPYSFWPIHSAYTWALRSIDHPQMLMAYMRLDELSQKVVENLPGDRVASRLRGKLNLGKLPFMPDWMGDDYIDPARIFFPPKMWLSPFEMAAQQENTDIGAAERILGQLQNDGEIQPDEYQAALNSHSGPVWDRAVYLARQDDTEGRSSAFDLVSMFTSPHFYMSWAYNQLSGHPERSGSLAPLTRSIGGLSAILGFNPAGPWNPEAAIRVQQGKPAFDRFDDYRAEREITTLMAEGKISLEAGQRAMIEHTGPIWDEAVKRSVARGAGGNLAGFALEMLGIQINSYPEGEAWLRRLDGEYKAALATEDADTINKFYENHPEYVARRALFKTPEERMRMFLIDELWGRYNDLPALTKKEVREQFGPLFEQAFVNRETRNYDSMSSGTLSVWLKLLGGDPPGSMQGYDAPPLELAPPEVAQRAQAFYGLRPIQFPDWFDQNEVYWKLDKKAQKQFMRDHPDFEAYMNWRNDWLLRNPDAAPYITDKPPTYKSEQAYQQALAAQPALTAQEWQYLLGLEAWRLVEDHKNGEPIPEALADKIGAIAAQTGMGGTTEQLLAHIEGLTP